MVIFLNKFVSSFADVHNAGVPHDRVGLQTYKKHVVKSAEVGATSGRMRTCIPRSDSA